MLSAPIDQASNEPLFQKSIAHLPTSPVQRIAQHSLQNGIAAEKRSKKNALQELTSAPTGAPTIVSKTKTFAVTDPNNQPPSLIGRITNFFKNWIKPKEKEKSIYQLANESTAKKAVPNGMLSSPGASNQIPTRIDPAPKSGQIKKNSAKETDDVMGKIFAVFKRLILLVEDEARSILAALEGRTEHVEQLTELSTQIHWALSKKDANGAVNFNDDPKTKELIDKARQIVKLPDGYEWNAEQVAHAKKNIEDTKSSDQNVSKWEQTKVQANRQKSDTLYTMISSLLHKLGELLTLIARNMST